MHPARPLTRVVVLRRRRFKGNGWFRLHKRKTISGRGSMTKEGLYVILQTVTLVAQPVSFDPGIVSSAARSTVCRRPAGRSHPDPDFPDGVFLMA